MVLEYGVSLIGRVFRDPFSSGRSPNVVESTPKFGSVSTADGGLLRLTR